jgi:hypothetical protein
VFTEAVSLFFRRRRMRRFERAFEITSETRILDVGGTPLNWSLARVRPKLTILNMPRAQEAVDSDVAWVSADGRELPFRDGAFDIVFSNSVIEHVGGPANQQNFAREIARVGKGYWVQTPNRWFPVEHHMLTPFVHYLPRTWQGAILRRASVWQWIARPRPDQRQFYIEHYLAQVRLLDANALCELFPESTLIRERLFGLTKSLIAMRR